MDARWVAAWNQILMSLFMEIMSIMIVCRELFVINIRSAVQSITLWYLPISTSAVPSIMSTFCLMSEGCACSRVKISWFDARRASWCRS